MATTGPPFDKPMTELREAFVRARFAQEDVFGLPSIEAWLERQRKAERPAELVWRRFIDAERVRRPFHVRELPDLAVPQELPRGFSIRQMADVCDPLVAMLCESVDRKRVDVLPADERLTLFLLKGEDGAPAHAFAITPQSKERRSGDPLAYTLYVPSDKDLLRVVLSRGWSAGPKKIATAARRLLCDGLEACIGEERGSAEADFDTAVAVSADGTKIVHADWVVVVPAELPEPWAPRRNMTVFPGAAFRERKVLKSNERMRLQPHYDPCSRRVASAEDAGRAAAEQFADIVRSPEPSQAFGYLDKGVVAKGYRDSCLITTADFCPSPLPDGGVEVTV